MSLSSSISGGGGGAGGGSGDVAGPASSTDNAVARFDGAGGKTLQDSVVTVADTTGEMQWVGNDAIIRTGAGNQSIHLRSEGTGRTYFNNGVNAQASIDANGSLIHAGANGYQALGVVGADGTLPAFIPDRADPNTGVGHGPSADELSLIAGGVEAVRLSATAIAANLNINGTVAGGITITGGDAASEQLTLIGSSHATGGDANSVDVFGNAARSRRGVLRVYGPGTDDSNYSRLSIYGTDSGSAYILNEAAGTGTASLLRLQSGSTLDLMAGFALLSGALQLGGNADNGLARNGVGVVRATDGSTGIGSFLTKRLVEANTAGVGSPNILAATESRTLLTNEGVTAMNHHTLPAAATGLEFIFYVQDADGITVTAGADDTIRVGASVSSAAGTAANSTIGGVLHLVAINAIEWVAIASTGTWTLT